MKKVVFLFLSFLFLLSSASTVAQIVKFRKVIGNDGYEVGRSVIQCIDTGYVVAGSTSSFGAGSTDMYLIKTDSFGVPVLHKTIGGIGVEQGTCIRQTADSGYVFLGYTNSYGSGGYDLYLVKLDRFFNALWGKTYGGADWDFGYSVEQTNDGGYIICGSTYSYGAGDQDYYMIKTNANGDTTWTRTFGGANEDVAKSVTQTADGGFLVTGYTMSMGDLNGDIYTVRTDSMGDTLWTNRYGGAGVDKGSGILEEASTGKIFIGGETSAGANTDGAIIQLTPPGAYFNSYSFPAGPAYDGFNSIAQDAQGKFALAGSTNNFGLNGELFFLILNNDLSFFYATTYGTPGNENGASAEGTFDNGFIICGTTNGFNNGLDDIYLIKTDTMGLSNSSGSETFFTVGINEAAAEMSDATLFYPNPATDHVYIEFDTDEKNVHLTVCDLLGKEILKRNFDASASTPYYLEFPELCNGAYFIRVDGKISATAKLIINR